jgi:hypothetical protein
MINLFFWLSPNIEELQLIERVETKDAEHGAKYYRLTEAGIYRLFLSTPTYTGSYLLTPALKNYGNLAFFKTFLYPYFERESLMSLSIARETAKDDIHHSLNWHLYVYLQTCCIAMEDFLERATKMQGQPWDDVLEIHRSDLHRAEGEIWLRRNWLLITIIMTIASSRKTDFNAISTMSLDNKFMKNVDDLHTVLEKGYKKCMDVREKS